MNLLEQFIAHECDAQVRRLIEDALADVTRSRLHFEFNHFEVTIERNQNLVVLEDVLDGAEAGVQRVNGGG